VASPSIHLASADSRTGGGETFQVSGEKPDLRHALHRPEARMHQLYHESPKPCAAAGDDGPLATRRRNSRDAASVETMHALSGNRFASVTARTQNLFGTACPVVSNADAT